MAVFFAPKVLLTTSGAPSAVDPTYDIVYLGVTRNAVGEDLAHELGHRLIGPQLEHKHLQSPLMRLRDFQILGQEIVDLECRAARGDHKALFEIIRRSK
jgi:hypothetical protein